MAAPLIWDFKINGAGEAQRQLQSIGAATRGAKTDTVEYARELRRQSRDASAVINADLYRSRILIAQHPVLRNTIQTAQHLTSVMRTAVAVQTMLNTAMLLTQGANAQQTANANELALEQAKLNDMKERGLEGTIQFQEQEEKVNTLLAQQKDLSNQSSQAWMNNVFNFVSGGALIAGSLVQVAGKIPAVLGIFTSLGTVLAVGSGWFTPIIGAFGTLASWASSLATNVLILSGGLGGLAAAAGVAVGAFLGLWLRDIAPPPSWLDGKAFLDKLFFTDIPNMVKSAADWFGQLSANTMIVWAGIQLGLSAVWSQMKSGMVGLWNGFAVIANVGIGSITKGIEGFVNMAITAINVLIKAYNSAVAIVGGKGMSLIPNLSLSVPQIPMISAAAGFNGVVSRPTMFLAGEGGQSEHVKIGAGGGSGGSKVTIVNITVKGNVWSERELSEKILRKLEEDLIDRGM